MWLAPLAKGSMAAPHEEWPVSGGSDDENAKGYLGREHSRYRSSKCRCPGAGWDEERIGTWGGSASKVKLSHCIFITFSARSVIVIRPILQRRKQACLGSHSWERQSPCSDHLSPLCQALFGGCKDLIQTINSKTDLQEP